MIKNSRLMATLLAILLLFVQVSAAFAEDAAIGASEISYSAKLDWRVPDDAQYLDPKVNQAVRDLFAALTMEGRHGITEEGGFYSENRFLLNGEEVINYDMAADAEGNDMYFFTNLLEGGMHIGGNEEYLQFVDTFIAYLDVKSAEAENFNDAQTYIEMKSIMEMLRDLYTSMIEMAETDASEDTVTDMLSDAGISEETLTAIAETFDEDFANSIDVWIQENLTPEVFEETYISFFGVEHASYEKYTINKEQMTELVQLLVAPIAENTELVKTIIALSDDGSLTPEEIEENATQFQLLIPFMIYTLMEEIPADTYIDYTRAFDEDGELAATRIVMEVFENVELLTEEEAALSEAAEEEPVQEPAEEETEEAADGEVAAEEPAAPADAVETDLEADAEAEDVEAPADEEAEDVEAPADEEAEDVEALADEEELGVISQFAGAIEWSADYERVYGVFDIAQGETIIELLSEKHPMESLTTDEGDEICSDASTFSFMVSDQGEFVFGVALDTGSNSFVSADGNNEMNENMLAMGWQIEEESFVFEVISTSEKAKGEDGIKTVNGTVEVNSYTETEIIPILTLSYEAAIGGEALGFDVEGLQFVELGKMSLEEFTEWMDQSNVRAAKAMSNIVLKLPDETLSQILSK